MKADHQFLVSTAVVGVLGTGSVLAQSDAGGVGPLGPSSAPGSRPMAQWGAHLTPGWRMMTAAERREHQKRLQTLQRYEECKTYMEEHRAAMSARATERGRQMAMPKRDACAPLQK